MAVSLQCMTKFTTNKKKKRNCATLTQWTQVMKMKELQLYVQTDYLVLWISHIIFFPFYYFVTLTISKAYANDKNLFKYRK